MDCSPTNGKEAVIDIGSCIETSQEVEATSHSDNAIENSVSVTICGVPMNVDGIAKGENSASLSNSSNNVDKLSPDKVSNNSKREKRKSMTAKKPPKPPIRTKGSSLDAADQKLIKEISELAMVKRSRIERMKALKKMKAAKASSSLSAMSSGNLIAMVFTVIFCIVVVFQGCHSWGISSAIPIPGSHETNGIAETDIFVVKDQRNLSANGVQLTGAQSTNTVMKLVPDSDSNDEARKS